MPPRSRLDRANRPTLAHPSELPNREGRRERRRQWLRGRPIDAPMRKVTEAMCEAFSGPAKNYHTDREESIKLGFPEIVVQGMLSVCMIAEMMTQRFGLGFLIGGRFDVRLVNVLWCDEI